MHVIVNLINRFIYPFLQWPRGLRVGLRSVACWNCEFESRGDHGYQWLGSVVFCKVEVSASSYHSPEESYRLWRV
jgi:hypothetical protein